jgi:hypothetical protein
MSSPCMTVIKKECDTFVSQSSKFRTIVGFTSDMTNIKFLSDHSHVETKFVFKISNSFVPLKLFSCFK